MRALFFYKKSPLEKNLFQRVYYLRRLQTGKNSALASVFFCFIELKVIKKIGPASFAKPQKIQRRPSDFRMGELGGPHIKPMAPLFQIGRGNNLAFQTNGQPLPGLF